MEILRKNKLLLLVLLLSCNQPSTRASKPASNQFDSMQVEILKEKDHSDSIEKHLLKAE